MLKFKITQAQFDKLSDDLKNEYKKDGDEYALDLSGGPETSPELQRALDRERESNKTLKAELATAEKEREDATDELDKVKANRSRAEKDLDRIEKKAAKDLETANAANAEKLAKRDKALDAALRQSAAKEIASKISTAPELMTDHVLKRLAVTYDADDMPVLTYLDKDGKPDVKLNADALGNEIKADPKFKPVIVGTRASGSRAEPTHRQSPSGRAGEGDKPTDFAALPLADRRQHYAERLKPPAA